MAHRTLPSVLSNAGQACDNPLPIRVVTFEGSEVELRTVGEVGAYFGVGSALHCWVAKAAAPPPTPVELAERQLRAEAHQRLEQRVSLGYAFAAVGECIALVEAHAVALYETQPAQRDAWVVEHDVWRKHVHASLALIYERSPELLPIGPAVHADCYGEDF